MYREEQVTIGLPFQGQEHILAMSSPDVKMTLEDALRPC
jgi:hypothetical protein